MSTQVLEVSVNVAAIDALLTRLLSENNEVRKSGENDLTTFKKQAPNAIVMALVSSLENSTPTELRQMACSVLHLALVPLKSEESLWMLLLLTNQEAIRTSLIHRLQNEREPAVLRKLCDLISDLATHLTEIGTPWNELLSIIFTGTTSPDPLHREYSLNIFSQLALRLPSDTFRPHFDSIKQILLNGLTDEKTLKVRVSALDATTSFIQIMEPVNTYLSIIYILPLSEKCVVIVLNAFFLKNIHIITGSG